MIGWIWIALAALMAFAGAIAFVFQIFIIGPHLKKLAPAITPPPLEFGPLAGFLFRHFGALALTQLAVAAFIFVSALMFLRLRPWARVSLEVITWLALLYIIMFGTYWLFTWLRLPPPPALGGGSELPGEAFRLGGAVMGVAMTLIFSVPLVVLLRYVRGATVRVAFGRPGGTAP